MSFKIQDCDGGIGSGEHLKSYNTICGGLAIKKRLKTPGISLLWPVAISPTKTNYLTS